VQFMPEPLDPTALAGETEAFAPCACPSLHYADLWNQHVLVLLLTRGQGSPSVRPQGPGSTWLLMFATAPSTGPLLPPSQRTETGAIQQAPLGSSASNNRARFVA